MVAKNPNLNLATAAVRNASRLLLRDFFEVRLLRASIKGADDFALKAMIRAENSIVKELQISRPYYGFKCKISGEKKGLDPTRSWIINGIDGFNNYSHGLPYWVMTLALEHKGKTILSLIYNPLENEMYTVEKGSGSWMNNTRIRVSNKPRLSDSIIGTETESEILDEDFERYRYLTKTAAGIRSIGSASLDLANVSCGRLDGYWTAHLKPSNLQAACLLVAEAGGLVEQLENSKNFGIVAAGSESFSVLAFALRNFPES